MSTTVISPIDTATFAADLAETHYVDGASARFAYRRFGANHGVPLVMCTRLRGTIDHWDPALLDVLATERDVILFDNRGTGASTGTPPRSIDELAAGAVEFTEALGLEQVDLMGWSLGGWVAQTVALEHPGLVRRLIVTGSDPGGVPDQPKAPEKVWEVVSHEVLSDEDFLYVLFPETDAGREAGLRSLRRLDRRLALATHRELSPEAVGAQLGAISSFAGLWERITELSLPVLVANGAHDVIVHAYATYAMSQRLENAKVVLYSDAGHAFLFQHYEDFGREVLDFLREGTPGPDA